MTAPDAVAALAAALPERGSDLYRAFQFAMQDADRAFELAGDTGTRNYLDDYLFPAMKERGVALAAAGYRIVREEEGLPTVDWWERALAARNGSNRGMAEFVVATLARLPAPPPAPEPNHYDWFMPADPTAAVDAYLDDFEAKLREALTDPYVHDMAQSVLPLIAAYRQARTPPPALEVERRDFDALRVVLEWPTPNHMRKAAEALDLLTPAKYGDILRWFADRCDERVWHINAPEAAQRLEQARAAIAALPEQEVDAPTVRVWGEDDRGVANGGNKP